MLGNLPPKPLADTIPVAIEVRGILDELLPRHRLVGRANAKKRIYHDSECSAGRSIPREHRIFFDSPAEAEEKGYRACSRCHGASASDDVFHDAASVF